MGTTTALLTFEEFEKLPDDSGKLELLDGELICMPPPKHNHLDMVHRLYELLKAPSAGVGGKVYMEAGYLLGNRNWLRPDVSITHPSQPYGDYLEGAPALAVEVISESNTAAQMNRKVREYLDHGGHEVWVVYPQTRTVWVHRPGQATEFRGVLTTALLPCLSISLAELFG